MPPKRKRKVEASPEKETKKETKEEKKKRIAEEKLRAKKWMEERRKRALAARAGKETTASKKIGTKSGAGSAAAPKVKKVKKAKPKVKTTRGTPRGIKESATMTSSPKASKVEEKDSEEEEESLKPRVKRMRIAKKTEEPVIEKERQPKPFGVNVNTNNNNSTPVNINNGTNNAKSSQMVPPGVITEDEMRKMHEHAFKGNPFQVPAAPTTTIKESEPLPPTSPKVYTQVPGPEVKKSTPISKSNEQVSAYDLPTPARQYMSPNSNAAMSMSSHTPMPPAAVPMQHFMTPAAAIAQQNGSHVVYVPVNLTPAPAPVPVPATVPISTSASAPFSTSINTNGTKMAPIVPIVQVPEKMDADQHINGNGEAEKKENVIQPAMKEVVEIVDEEPDADAHVNADADIKMKGALDSLFSNGVKDIKDIIKYILIAVIAILSLSQIGSIVMDGNELSTPFSDGKASTASENATLCFNNYGLGGENEEMDVVDVTGCDNPSSCPQYGRCEGGKLIDCLLEDIPWEGGFYVPSNQGDQCVVSSSAMESMLKLHSTLVDLTVEYVCRSNFGLGPTCELAKEDIVENGSILFKADAISDLTGIDKDDMETLLKMMENEDIVTSEVTKSDDEISEDLIGMSESYINNQLPIPAPCYFRIAMWDLIRVVSTFFYGFVMMVLGFMWSIAVANPIPTLVVGIITYAVSWVRTKRAKVAGLRREAVEIQNIAYDKLIVDCEEDGEGCAALHLRDEIAHEIYPEPCVARQRFNTVVWPKVLALVRADNRITKSRKSVGGKALEWWQWVANTSSRKSRLSLAGNTNGTTPFKEGMNAGKGDKQD